jgi:hypothetical protein
MVFEFGLCRDDPSAVLKLPLRQLRWWYDIGLAWKTAMNNATKPTPMSDSMQPATPRLIR